MSSLGFCRPPGTHNKLNTQLTLPHNKHAVDRVGLNRQHIKAPHSGIRLHGQCRRRCCRQHPCNGVTQSCVAQPPLTPVTQHLPAQPASDRTVTSHPGRFLLSCEVPPSSSHCTHLPHHRQSRHTCSLGAQSTCRIPPTPAFNSYHGPAKQSTQSANTAKHRMTCASPACRFQPATAKACTAS